MASADEILVRIKTATVKAVQELNLVSDNPAVPDIGANVQSWIAYDPNNTVWPCVALMYQGMSERIGSGDTENLILDAVPMGCSIVDRAQASREHANEAVYLSWRGQIRDAFHQRRPLGAFDAGLQYVYCLVEAQQIWDPKAAEFELLASNLVLNFYKIKYVPRGD